MRTTIIRLLIMCTVLTNNYIQCLDKDISGVANFLDRVVFEFDESDTNHQLANITNYAVCIDCYVREVYENPTLLLALQSPIRQDVLDYLSVHQLEQLSRYNDAVREHIRAYTMQKNTVDLSQEKVSIELIRFMAAFYRNLTSLTIVRAENSSLNSHVDDELFFWIALFFKELTYLNVEGNAITHDGFERAKKFLKPTIQLHLARNPATTSGKIA